MINFEKAVADMQHLGFLPPCKPVHIALPDARNLLFRGLNYYTGGKAVWLPAYDEVADWLTDNKCRGLFLFGQCGVGKSLICTRILPVLINYYQHKVLGVYDAQQMNANVDLLKSEKLLCIDDVGTENVSVKYGERRYAFSEIADHAEKNATLLIVTTNLSLSQLSEKYGERTADRIIGLTRRVEVRGNSFRY